MPLYGNIFDLKNSINRRINGDLKPLKGFGIFILSYHPLIYLNLSQKTVNVNTKRMAIARRQFFFKFLEAFIADLIQLLFSSLQTLKAVATATAAIVLLTPANFYHFRRPKCNFQPLSLTFETFGKKLWFHETNRNKPKQTRNRSCFGSKRNLFLFVSRTPYLGCTSYISRRCTMKYARRCTLKNKQIFHRPQLN